MDSDVKFEEAEKGVFQCWKIKDGGVVRDATIVLVYKGGDGSTRQMKSNSFGFVQSMAKLKEGDELAPGQFLMRLRRCEHPVVMKDLCADCGEDLRQKYGLPGERAVSTHARVAMIHHIPELQITPEEAKSYGTADEQNLLKQRRLVLLVDLDQTLIHTTNEDVNPKLKDVFHFQLYGSTSPWYHTRLRPHTRHFLETISKLYELHICTFGARLYAHTVAKILDPEGKLFGHRILSREECFDANLKIANLKALFPCGDRLVCIIDDREDVWNFAPNVVHVKPYRFFKHTGDINAPPGFAKNGQSKETSTYEKFDPANIGDGKEKAEEKKEEKTDEAEDGEGVQEEERVTVEKKNENEGGENSEVAPILDEPTTSAAESLSESVEYSSSMTTDDVDQDDDDYLYHLEDILTRIHTAFYQMHDQLPREERPPDLKSVVPYVKNKVLKKCNLVFSGVVPTNVNIESSSIFKTAVAFGANCQKDIILNHHHHHHHHHGRHRKSNSTTHLVAAKWGTAKVYQARKTGSAIKIVTPQWLWCCAERWERVDERLFLLNKEHEHSDTKGRSSARNAKNDEDIFVETVESGNSLTTTDGDDIVELPISNFGADREDDVIDLDYEPDTKKKRENDDGDDEVSLDSTDSTSSTNTKSKTEEEASTGSVDEEMAEALQREFE